MTDYIAYTILAFADTDAITASIHLATSVQDAMMTQGYQPLGGVAFVYEHASGYYIASQAMVASRPRLAGESKALGAC